VTIIQSIEFFTAINFWIVGLSHLLQPKSWVVFFIFLHSKGIVGNIFNALLTLFMGSLLLSFHWVWHWPQIVVTVIGLAQTVKGLLYLLKPSIGLRSIARVKKEGAIKFRWVGLIMVILSVVIMYELIAEKAFQNI
jgi:uncharacterized protein YjeT (DUF2065 family)